MNDDQDKRNLIAEQWWPGILFWIVMVGIIGAIARCVAAELPPPVATIYVEWHQSPPVFIQDEVIEWRIYRTYPLPRVQIAVSEVPHAWITVTEGERFVVTARTSTEESRDSVEWTVRLPYPDPIVRVTIQTSHDAKAWADHQAFEFAESKAEFYRLRIETEPTPEPPP